MINSGFPNTDMYSEHEAGGGETFWPSFTDIMMVIVMTFLLITVAMILNNWELMRNLDNSVVAEEQARVKAKNAMKVLKAKAIENETLEQRMRRMEALLATQRKNLQKSQSALTISQKKTQVAQASIISLQQKNKTDADNAQAEVLKLKKEFKLNSDEAQASILSLQAEKKKNARSLMSVNEALEKTGKELSMLRQRDIDGQKKITSLQGEYDQLDKKYQKLVRPARSTKNKHVVRVVYSKRNGKRRYQYRDAGQSKLRVVSRRNLNKALAKLKSKHGDNLYVKIIIPKDSRVSHNDAWKFTSEILKRYDYYHSAE